MSGAGAGRGWYDSLQRGRCFSCATAPRLLPATRRCSLCLTPKLARAAAVRAHALHTAGIFRAGTGRNRKNRNKKDKNKREKKTRTPEDREKDRLRREQRARDALPRKVRLPPVRRLACSATAASLQRLLLASQPRWQRRRAAAPACPRPPVRRHVTRGCTWNTQVVIRHLPPLLPEPILIATLRPWESEIEAFYFIVGDERSVAARCTQKNAVRLPRRSRAASASPPQKPCPALSGRHAHYAVVHGALQHAHERCWDRGLHCSDPQNSRSPPPFRPRTPTPGVAFRSLGKFCFARAYILFKNIEGKMRFGRPANQGGFDGWPFVSKKGRYWPRPRH